MELKNIPVQRTVINRLQLKKTFVIVHLERDDDVTLIKLKVVSFNKN